MDCTNCVTTSDEILFKIHNYDQVIKCLVKHVKTVILSTKAVKYASKQSIISASEL